MIGRTTTVRPFELIRWAREQAVEKQLKPVEAHVLLILATYADSDAVAWPSIRTIAERCGLKVRKVKTKTGAYFTCSTVSSALQALQDKGLIWTKQAGHGQTARRELLFNPDAQPSADTEGSSTPSHSLPSDQPSVTTDAQPSVLTEENYQREGANNSKNSQQRTARESLPPRRKASPPSRRKGELSKLNAFSIDAENAEEAAQRRQQAPPIPPIYKKA